MKKTLCLLNILLLTTSLFAQSWNRINHIYRQKYFNRNGDFFIFLSDSVVATSLNSYGDTAKFQISGILFLQDRNLVSKISMAIEKK